MASSHLIIVSRAGIRIGALILLGAVLGFASRAHADMVYPINCSWKGAKQTFICSNGVIFSYGPGQCFTFDSRLRVNGRPNNGVSNKPEPRDFFCASVLSNQPDKCVWAEGNAETVKCRDEMKKAPKATAPAPSRGLPERFGDPIDNGEPTPDDEPNASAAQ